MLAHPQAGGGGSPKASGTTGPVARNIVAISGGRSRSRWRAVRTTLASTCWLSAPWRVRLPPQTFRITTAGRMACSARQLVASIDRSHKKRNTAANSVARCRAKRSASSSGGGASNEPTEPGYESAADRCQTVLAQLAVVASGHARQGPSARPLAPARPTDCADDLPAVPCIVGAGDSDRIGAALRGSSDTTPTRRARAHRRSRPPEPWWHRRTPGRGKWRRPSSPG